MDTRIEIVKIADALIREKGYNAFSFTDIARQLNIKNASVHYHFPTKTDLGIAIIHQHQQQLSAIIKNNQDSDCMKKMNAFFSIYTIAKSENKICLVGSLATDLYTVEPEIQDELKKLVKHILGWVTAILEEGRAKKVFYFDIDARTKALMIVTNMLAAVQLTRLTTKKDFEKIKQTIINDLTNNK
ncbi:TetR/AcrR family transcriptional regulator [Parafilimonas terrae]|uniref:Transcriptional regulator, TetR family n=1 Tax=Parafilimonas terrae TaxID=1465490 RepID=A0A1I5R3E0_9BACT|nr:TetR/AcrR family transcriptional regulator [Parafilimonas terrae]SFP53038.1 transcriptional regulator, TetR family [Parafilimonas terrae]